MRKHDILRTCPLVHCTKIGCRTLAKVVRLRERAACSDGMGCRMHDDVDSLCQLLDLIGGRCRTRRSRHIWDTKMAMLSFFAVSTCRGTVWTQDEAGRTCERPSIACEPRTGVFRKRRTNLPFSVRLATSPFNRSPLLPI
jgi:hypothetical protein